MSSTNRSNKRDNHVADYYITPSKPINDLILAMKNDDITGWLFNETGNFHEYLSFLDPCAGGKKSSNPQILKSSNPQILKSLHLNESSMSYPTVLSRYGVKNICTIDIREDSLADIIADYRTHQIDKRDIIMTNPPFNIAEEIIRKAMSDCKDGGFVIMLLRLNFFGAKKREGFWSNNMPIITFIHRERISFTKGSTDSIEYMHCIWKKGVSQNHTKLVIV